jgi:hypothetical protein
MSKRSAFISSTSLDLEKYREAAGEICRKWGLFPIMMKDFPAMDAGAVAGSKRQLDEADVYIGIFAHRMVMSRTATIRASPKSSTITPGSAA